MRLFGLIGYPLGHSFSQKYFSEKFTREGITDARYELFSIPDISGLKSVLAAHPSLCGLNVTIPYKEAVLPFLDDLDETAAGIGAVNCIRIREGRLSGFNTDAHGFEQSLRSCVRDSSVFSGARALILGTGGASKAVAFVFRRLGVEYLFVSRSTVQVEGQISYADLPGLNWTDYQFVINTTPVGTYPKTDECPDLPFEKISSQHLVFDLVYNPPQTLLLQRSLMQGANIQNGLDMLQIQAEKAWDVWQNR